MFGVIAHGPSGHREWFDSFEQAASMLCHEFCWAVIQKIDGIEYIIDGYAVDQATAVAYGMPVVEAP